MSTEGLYMKSKQLFWGVIILCIGCLAACKKREAFISHTGLFGKPSGIT